MKRMLTGVAAGVAVVSMLTVGALAQRPAQGTPPAAGKMQRMGQMDGMRQGRGGPFARLNLTDQQRDQVQKIMEENRTKREGEAQAMQALHEKLRDAIFADGGPTGAAQGIASEIQQAQAAMMTAHIATQEAIARILTPEQRKQMREMRMGPRGMMGPGGMGPMGGPGRGMRGPGGPGGRH
jgi:Spy/CpxP family protein refolding chaperone